MPIFDGRNGGAFYHSRSMAALNRAGSNGTVKPQVLFARPEDYGGRFRALMSKPVSMPDRLAQKRAFEFEAPARKTEMGAFKEEVNMRGRAKGAYNITAGYAGRRMTLTAPESGSPVSGIGQFNRITAPPEGYVEIGVGGLAGGGEQWEMVFNDFTKDIQGFWALTTASQELRAYNKGRLAVQLGQEIFGGNLQMMVGINGIKGELDRWLDERGNNLTGTVSGKAQKSIGTIQTRLLNAINQMRTILGLQKVTAEWPTLPTSPKLPALPGSSDVEKAAAVTPAAAPATAVAAVVPSWLERNKVLVIGGIALAVLGLGYAWYAKQK